MSKIIAETDTLPIGRSGQPVVAQVKSKKNAAEAKARSMTQQAVNRSQSSALKDVAEATHRIGLTVTDPNHPMVSKRKETIQKTARVKGDDREKAINAAIAHYRRKGYKVHDHHYIGTVNEENEENMKESWNLGNRDPQKGIKVGHKVRSYDFPGMHDDHYIEGHVVGETPHSYHIRVNKVVRSGKEIPTPAHMSHVEAPKGRGMFSNAYAVHKILAKQDSVAAKPEQAQGAAKTFANIRGKK